MLLTTVIFNPQATAGLLSEVRNRGKCISLRGNRVTLKLGRHKVPAHATEVIVYAQVRCGSMNRDVDGQLIIESEPYSRVLFFHSYRQNAWTFNSEYFTLPVSADRKIQARVRTIARGNFRAYVRIVGYTSPSRGTI